MGDQVDGDKAIGVTGPGQGALRREDKTGVERSEAEATGVTGPGQGPPRRDEGTPVERSGREIALSPDANSVTGATEERQPTVVSIRGKRSDGAHGDEVLNVGLNVPGSNGHRSRALWSMFAELGMLRWLETCCRSNPATSVWPAGPRTAPIGVGGAATGVTSAVSIEAGTAVTLRTSAACGQTGKLEMTSKGFELQTFRSSV